MNNFIENVSLFDVHTGRHSDAGINSMLIQIVDMDALHPSTIATFREVYQFKFDDVEDSTDPGAITDEDAEAIASILERAQERGMNVIVHCIAGLCRSGAVVEAGVAMGFNPPDRIRHPNTLVKGKIFKALGLAITAENFAFNFID